MIRWGLCCQFLDAPIKFRTATHRYVATLSRAARRDYLTAIAANNAAAIADSARHCRSLGIGAFRINSQILPLGTHPVSGYSSTGSTATAPSGGRSSRPARSRASWTSG